MKIIRKKITLINNNEILEIDKLIENNFGLIFHEVEFNRIVTESFNTVLSYFIAYNESNKIISICPLHTFKKGLIKTTYSNPALYEIPFGGLVWNQELTTINELLKKIKLSYNESLVYWSNIQIKDNEYESCKIAKQEFQTGIINLEANDKYIWENAINPKKRNKIRKAKKNNIKIKFMGKEGLDLYYSLMRELHEKMDLKMKSKKYYENILKTYFRKNQAIILLAEKNGDILSGVILIGNKNVMHYWQGASKRNVENLGQGELLQWEAIKWAKENGSQYYDLCVVEKDRLPNIAKFKLGFSKDIKPFYNISIRPLTFRILNRMNKWL